MNRLGIGTKAIRNGMELEQRFGVPDNSGFGDKMNVKVLSDL